MSLSGTLVVVNPKSRDGWVAETWSKREKEIRKALEGDVLDVIWTNALDHGSKVIGERLKEGVKRILVIGGDGTVSEAVHAFMRAGAFALEAELMILPAGRGDDFFKSIAGKKFADVNSAWDFGLRILREGKAGGVDVGSIQWVPEGIERHFINVVSFGYPGLVVERVLHPSAIASVLPFSKSSWTYLFNSALGMVSYRPIPAEIKVDGQIFFSGRVFSGFILNGKYNGGGMVWSNSAKIDDGVLDLVLAEPRSPLSTLLSFQRMWTGDWSGVEGVHSGRGRKIEVCFDQALQVRHPYFEIDGDQPRGCELPHAVFELKPKALRIRKISSG